MRMHRSRMVLPVVGLALVAFVASKPFFQPTVNQTLSKSPVSDVLSDSSCQECENLSRPTCAGTSISQLAQLVGQTVDRHRLQTWCGKHLPETFTLYDIADAAGQVGLAMVESDFQDAEQLLDSMPCMTVNDTGTYVLAATSADRHDVFLWAPSGEVTRLPISEYLRRFGSIVLSLAQLPPETPPPLVISCRYAARPVKGIVGEHCHFTLFNPGNSPVNAFHVASSCPCAKVSLSPQIVPPKGASTLRVEAVSPAESGAKFTSWPVVIRANPSDPVTLSWTLNARIARPVHVSPRLFHLDGLIEGFAPQKLSIAARDTDRRGSVLLAPAYLDNGLRWGGATTTGNTCEAVLYLDSPSLQTLRDGTFSLQAMLYDRTRPTLRWQVVVSGSVRRPLEFFPKELFVGSLTPGERVIRVVRLKNETTAKPAIELPQPDRLNAQFDGDNVRVEVVAPEQSGPFQYNLLIHANGRPANLPVSGVVTSKEQ